MRPRTPLLWSLLLLLRLSVDSTQPLVPALYSKACVVCSSRFPLSLGLICCASPVCDPGPRWQCMDHPVSAYKDVQKVIKHKRSLGHQISEEKKEEHEMAVVPWQTLWLLQSSERECDYQEAFLRFSKFTKDLQAVDWLRNRPEEPIGHCPVQFRPHVDPHRWLPRNLVVSECLCEGSPCARHGLHVCVTVFAIRSVYSLYTGKKRILIAVGCLCAIQKTRLAKVYNPQTVPDRR